ncbi:MAG TPA: glycerol kinase GlpK [Mycobacteriales bacterium]|nr:glycerol kinase GlpK [Mycobacteriales bacterium]
MPQILAIDAGTTGVTALLVDDKGATVRRGYREFDQHYPRPGWVEHRPEDIWQAVLGACGDVVDPGDPPVAVGITNQRETAVLWDRADLTAPCNAIVWQDRRTAAICDRLRADGVEPAVTEATGLRLDPYFTGTKLTWLAEHQPDVWRRVTDGGVVVGTVDSYLVARLTAGREHVTEASNASRTLLYSIVDGRWDADLAATFGVPMHALPEVRPNAGDFGTTDPSAFLGLRVPITGIAGDQQAALFGQVCFTPGESKCTYGTGSFVLVNTGDRLVRSPAGLLTTVAWDIGGGPVYALEGAVFVTGAAVQWLRDGLGIIGSAPDVEALARSVDDSGGVVFVPALTGLGAPDWDPHARGAILGITRGTTGAHLARATLEAIAFQVRDVVDAMTGDAAIPLAELSVDGGASANDLLCELQAAQLGVPVRRPAVLETTALGAAFLAGLGAGVWASTDELRETWRLDRRFDPEPGVRDGGAHTRWRRAVERAKDWTSDPRDSVE